MSRAMVDLPEDHVNDDDVGKGVHQIIFIKQNTYGRINSQFGEGVRQ